MPTTPDLYPGHTTQKRTDELTPGDRVAIGRGRIVRTVARAEPTGMVNGRSEPLWAVHYAEGSTPEWSGANGSNASGIWAVVDDAPEAVPAPKRGMRFLHAHQVTTDGAPMSCEVTRVTRYAVYFRNATGFRSYVTPDRFPDAVRDVVRRDLAPQS